jgi:hypothetical protein
MMRTDGPSGTNTIFITQNVSGQNQLCAARVPAFYMLLAEDRKAVVAAAAKAIHQDLKTPFSAVVMSGRSIHVATLGDSILYLAVINKKQELIYFSKINSILYSLAEEYLSEDEEKSNSNRRADLRDIQPNDSASLRDIYGNVIGETQLNQAVYPTVHSVELYLPEGSRAVVLHDQSGLIQKIPLDVMTTLLNDPEKLVKKMTAKKVFLMLTPLGDEESPKCLFYAENSAMLSRMQEVMLQAVSTRFTESKLARRKFSGNYLLIQPNQYLLEELERRLVEVRPKYAVSLLEVRRLLQRMEFFRHEKIEFDVQAFNNKVDKLLFAIYLKVYTTSRKSGGFMSLYRSQLADRELAVSLEEAIAYRFPEIENVKPHKTISRGNVANRILWLAGERYPEFVETTLQSLKHIQEHQQATPQVKKLHTNTAKLLNRLGPDGFAESARIFKSNDDSRVKKSVIKKFYVDHIESKNRNRI